MSHLRSEVFEKAMTIHMGWDISANEPSTNSLNVTGVVMGIHRVFEVLVCYRLQRHGNCRFMTHNPVKEDLADRSGCTCMFHEEDVSICAYLLESIRVRFCARFKLAAIHCLSTSHTQTQRSSFIRIQFMVYGGPGFDT